MKRLLIALLSMSLVTVGGITASAQTNEAEPVIANAAVSCSALANCPNNGIPALDGTGYQGGRNEDFVNSITTDSSTDSTTGTGINPNCPNNGIPPRDGTGYQGGRNEDFVSSAPTQTARMMEFLRVMAPDIRADRDKIPSAVKDRDSATEMETNIVGTNKK